MFYLLGDLCTAHIYSVELREAAKVDIVNNCVEEEVEVVMPCRASIQVVQSCDAVEVVYILPHTHQNFQ